MSYILDALKKSSEERQKLEVENRHPQSVMSDRPHHASHSNRKTSSSLAILCGLMVIAIITGGWLYYSVLDNTGKDRANSEVAPQNYAVDPPPPYPLPVTPKNIVSQQGASLTTQPDIKTGINQTKSSPELTTQQTLETKMPTQEPVDSIPLLKDLPFAVQASLPDMKYSGHAYSDNPALRMIMINTAIVREGDNISTDIKLLKITDNGLVMDYRGTKFRLDLF